MAIIGPGQSAAAAAAAPTVCDWRLSGDLAALVGAWALDRHIEGVAAMSGTAVFEAGESGWLAYREAGWMRLTSGQSFHAERRYLFQPRSNGFAVFFAETPPRLFHEVVLSEERGLMSGEAVHRCSQDLYRSRYAFRADGTFSIHHSVSGPRKSYRLDTLYRRLGPQ
jgi:Family of unknown function (DUF6314)